MNFNKKLSDLYWSFKDRRLAIAFNKRPGCHFLYLPETGRCTNIVISYLLVRRSNDDQLVIVITRAMDDRNALTLVRFDRLVDANKIYNGRSILISTSCPRNLVA